jgi:hypothetical protein
MSLAGHVARVGEKRNAYRVLMGKPEGKRPLGIYPWIHLILQFSNGIFYLLICLALMMVHRPKRVV